ncbi:unnamed protein product [Leptidea sinapis]|uniref:Cation-transporting P-type ATPase N-terminal domain-containing protein n=1 Tax=Leptidea sinapis TaxID=189913 RepID=A0A5E4R1G4_9NEOP|nr:unnamed protein product [Leptidea sinapis]
MKARSSSLSSISDLFRPNNPRKLRSRDLSSTRLDILKKEIQTDAHIISLRELYSLLGTDPENGLSTERAKELLDYYGPNTLTPTTQNWWPKLLLKSMCTGAVLCLTAYCVELSTKPAPSRDNLYLGCVLVAVDIICGLFSFFQNYKSSKIMKTFNSMIPMNTNCVRDGVLNTATPVRDLVKGDVVYVKAGDVIPADIRVIDSKGFKNLEAIEALGACTTICSDKTGTLTENKMKVRHIWIRGKAYDVNELANVFMSLLRCGALCSNATIADDGSTQGDASEKAIMNFLFAFGDPYITREQYPKVAEIPFNSDIKYQVSVHLDKESSRYIVVMKGAPEVILTRCSSISLAKNTASLDGDTRKSIERENEY